MLRSCLYYQAKQLNLSLIPYLIPESPRTMHFLKLSSYVAAAAVLAGMSFAWQPIAHRGVFHDVDDSQANAENTVGALYRANDLHMPGVELDVRLSSDGVVLVTHDVLTNRATVVDNYGGKLDSVDVALRKQPAVAGINIGSRTGAEWNHTPLKIYGRNSKLIDPSPQKMETLDEMLDHYKDLIAENGGKDFFLMLDIQSPELLERCADSVRSHGLQDSVYLKFFATKAIDSSSYRYKGPETCAAYAHYNGLTGLKIIPQFNNGEITNRNGQPVIDVFQTQLSVEDYLDCWAGAELNYRNVAASMTHVSASVAANDQVATVGATNAINWAKNKHNNRGTISILPNPDTGFIQNRYCSYWSFQSNNVAAAPFNQEARTAKANFIKDMGGKIDYVVVDTMGDVGHNRYITDYESYIVYLC